jgi:hypothetical protein
MAVVMWQVEMRQNKWQKEIKSTADQKTEEVKFITRIEYSSVVGDTCYLRISIRLLGLFIQVTYQVTERAVKSARGMLGKSNSRISATEFSGLHSNALTTQ